jgi:hypothetical protein
VITSQINPRMTPSRLKIGNTEINTYIRVAMEVFNKSNSEFLADVFGQLNIIAQED